MAYQTDVSVIVAVLFSFVQHSVLTFHSLQLQEKPILNLDCHQFFKKFHQNLTKTLTQQRICQTATTLNRT